MPLRQLRVALVGALVLVLLGTAAGLWWGSRRVEEHAATAVIMVNPLTGNAFSPDGKGADLVNLETEAQLVRSDSVARLVSRELAARDQPVEADATALTALLSGVSVGVPPNTQLLEITVRNRSADVAVSRAQAYADTYLAYRRARTESAVFDRRAQLEDQLGTRNQELAERLGELRGVTPGTARASLLGQQVSEITTQVSDLRTQLDTIGASSLDPGQVVTPAAPDPAGPLAASWVPPVGGGVAGLLAALMLISLARRRSGPDSTSPDLGEVTVLARIDPDDSARPVQAAWASLRAAVLAAGPARPLTVLVAPVTGAGHRTAEGLVTALVRAEYDVALLDLMGQPLDVPGFEPPQHATLDEIETAIDDHVASRAMAVTLADLGKNADVVVVSAGPIDRARAQCLAGLADLVVLAVDLGADSSSVAGAVDEVHRFGGTLLGVVVWGAR